MAGDQEIQQLELFCKDLYETTEPAKRAEAEKILINFQSSPNSMAQCCGLLERGTTVYTQLLASSTLIKLVSRPTQIVPLTERLQIKAYILNYLQSRQNLDSSVVRSLTQLYAKLVKSGWFDEDKEKGLVFHNVIADANPFLQGSIKQCTIGVQLLTTLIGEMNQYLDIITNSHLARLRKITSSFKCGTLLEIFSVCQNLLKVTLEKRATLNLEDPVQIGLINELLSLAENCYVSQVPGNWKPEHLDFAMLQPIVELYFVLPVPLSSKALSCLAEGAALGKNCSIDRKQEFVNQLLKGVLRILKSLHGLNQPDNYHEFCKLIDALKTHYQLHQLVNSECYAEFIPLLAKFTVDSLMQMLLNAPNSVYFLLQFWQNLSSSLAYLKLVEGKDHQLNQFVPQIAKAYLNARLDTVARVVREQRENPLDDDTIIEQEMEQLAVIARCDFTTTAEILAPTFDSTALAYQETLQRGTATPDEIILLEDKLSWLVNMMSAALAGRICFFFNSLHDIMDGDIASRVVRLMQLTDTRLAQNQPGCEHLEVAYLGFFEVFRRTCMGDFLRKAIRVYERMKELVGIESEAEVFTLLIRKVVTNLKYWSKNEVILQPTIEMLNELSFGNNGNMRKFVKLDEIQFLLNNHTGEHFPFLGLNKNADDLKRRTKFYKSLGRFVIIDSLEDKSLFTKFMTPFAATLEALGQTLSNTETTLFKSEETKWTVVGLARDLRGIIHSFPTRPPFLLFFEWIYPTYLPIFERAMQIWSTDPDVVTPLLKFYIELVHNRNDRLHFGDLSPNSVILFREISKTLCAYGNAARNAPGAPLLAVTKPVSEEMRLKEIMLCFKLLRTALCSSFVNFGVMRFYRDETIDNALSSFIKLTVTITIADLTQNPKLAMAYYGLLRYIAQDHMKFLCSIDPNVFLYILQTTVEGIISADYNVCMDSAAALDSIATHLYEQTMIIKEKKQPHLVGNEQLRILQTVEQHPESLQQALTSLLNLVIFEDCRNHWAMAKPVLALTLLNEEHYGRLRTQIIAAQPPEKQKLTIESFGKLFEAVERNLSARNKDAFSFNLVTFRRTMCGIS